jgi:hypothetical protein
MSAPAILTDETIRELLACALEARDTDAESSDAGSAAPLEEEEDALASMTGLQALISQLVRDEVHAVVQAAVRTEVTRQLAELEVPAPNPAVLNAEKRVREAQAALEAAKRAAQTVLEDSRSGSGSKEAPEPAPSLTLREQAKLRSIADVGKYANVRATAALLEARTRPAPLRTPSSALMVRSTSSVRPAGEARTTSSVRPAGEARPISRHSLVRTVIDTSGMGMTGRIASRGVR